MNKFYLVGAIIIFVAILGSIGCASFGDKLTEVSAHRPIPIPPQLADTKKTISQFGQDIYWVVDNNVPAYRPLKDLSAEEAGPYWDCGLLIRPIIAGDRAYYRDDEYDGEYQFIPVKYLSTDPRDSQIWEDVVFGRRESKDFTLRSQIGLAASTEEHPEITERIIKDMIRCRVLKPEEAGKGKKIEGERLQNILIDYSALVWN